MRHAIVSALLAAIVSTASTVHADDTVKGKKLLIVPLGGGIPGMSSSLSARLSEAVKEAADSAGARTEMAQTSLDDLLMINGCSLDSAACLRTVASTLAVDELVLGEISPGSGGATVAVRLVRVPIKGEKVEQTIALTESEDAKLADELAPKAAELFPGATLAAPPPAAVEETPPVEPPPIEQPPVETPRDEGGFDLGAVDGYSWAIAGGGVGIAAIGAVFLVLGNSTQDDIDRAPIDTFDDLERLRELEDRARTRFLVGDAKLIGGAAATLVGAALIIYQGGRGERATVSPMAARGGGGITFTWSLP